MLSSFGAPVGLIESEGPSHLQDLKTPTCLPNIHMLENVWEYPSTETCSDHCEPSLFSEGKRLQARELYQYSPGYC